jgi:2-dehydro-3-deoxyphosphooctonate aldolase (KDO 8-P synthase)
MKYQLDHYEVGDDSPLLLIAGPCSIEGLDLCREVAGEVKSICDDLKINYIFKGSFDKANRTSINGKRGLGLEEGLKVLSRIKEEFDVPVLTDVHEISQCRAVAEVCSAVQIPAFLCRQTDLLLAAGEAAARTNGVVNIKKGQFMSPEGMRHAVEKVKAAGCEKVLLTERGATFGYNNLVVDFRGLEIMREFAPVCFDATHSVQLPGGGGDKSGGDRRFVAPLTRAAMAVGVDALFIETHPDPENAWSDGPNMVPLNEMRALLEKCIRIREA